MNDSGKLYISTRECRLFVSLHTFGYIPVFYIIMSMDILGSEKAVKMVNNLDVHVLG